MSGHSGGQLTIKRNEAVLALVEERERSANERSAELSKANVVMQRTLARLAASQNIDSFLATALLELTVHAGGVEAYLFVKGAGANDPMRLRASFRGKGYQRGSVDDDPPVSTSGSPAIGRPEAEPGNAGRMVWRVIERATESEHRPAEIQQWHLRKGHQGEARYLLQVGDRTVGLVAIAFAHGIPLSESDGELLVALSQPIALALELSRLGEVANLAAKERAVLAERNRMARDVHDTLAQGFTAISLQLQAASLAGRASDRMRFIERATLEAKANLAESRRTIRLLRGLGPLDARPEGLIELLNDAVASRVGDSGIEWRVIAPMAYSEPALDEDSRRELKRIAQEAATNALKHARASSFDVRVTEAGGRLVIEFADNGCGFDLRAIQDGFGLIGMRERAERIGATIEIKSREGGSTTVRVSMTLHARK